MRTLLTLCACLIAGITWSQHPNWLPKETLLNYGEFGFFGGVEFSTIMVVDAYYENDADVRILKRSWQNKCTRLPTQTIFILHRRGDEIYYVHTDTVEYLLYDFGAMGGDTIKVILDIDDQGEPKYAEMLVESIDTLHLKDTFLLIQRIDFTFLEWSYGHVIIGVGGMGPMFPEYTLVDPGCGILVSYSTPSTETLCFVESACQLIRTDFDYSPFRTDQAAYYEDDEGRFYSIQLTEQSSGTEPMVLLPRSSIVNKPSECTVVYQFGWTFDQLELYDTTQFDIYNINNEPITIYLDRDIGDEWICYDQGGVVVMAFVKNMDTATVISTVDSVMTIGFKYLFEPQSDLNTIELQISKTRGIVQLFSFLHFPDYMYKGLNYDQGLPYEVLKPFKYIGEDLAMYNYSFLNVSWQEVNDNKPGDVLHVEESLVDVYGEGYFSQVRFAFRNRINVAGRGYNVWDYELRAAYLLDWNEESVAIYQDTVWVPYSDAEGVKSGFNTHPGVAVSNPDSTMATYSYGGIFNGHTSKSFYPPRWNKVDTCWNGSIETAADVVPSTWINRLGGPYYNRDGLVIPTGVIDYRLLKYYKLNNGEEWGEPLDFTVSTSAPQEALHVKVYPNPAGDLISIEGEFFSSNVQFEIYDIGGRLRLRISGMSSTSIDVSQLEEGIYFYKITDHNTVVSGKLVIAR
jgi:Secretion system C-terminal sorting domain